MKTVAGRRAVAPASIGVSESPRSAEPTGTECAPVALAGSTV